MDQGWQPVRGELRIGVFANPDRYAVGKRLSPYHTTSVLSRGIGRVGLNYVRETNKYCAERLAFPQRAFGQHIRATISRLVDCPYKGLRNGANSGVGLSPKRTLRVVF